MLQLQTTASLTLHFTLRTVPPAKTGSYRLTLTSRATNREASVILGTTVYTDRYLQGTISVNAGDSGDNRLDVTGPSYPGGFYDYKLVNYVGSGPETTIATGLAFVSREGTSSAVDWDAYSSTNTFKTYEQ